MCIRDRGSREHQKNNDHQQHVDQRNQVDLRYVMATATLEIHSLLLKAFARCAEPVSYTHLDVYKRQISFVTFDETDKMYRRMIIKVEKTNNLDKFIKYLGKNGFKVLDVSEE